MIGTAFVSIATGAGAFVALWAVMWLAAGEEREARKRKAGGARWGHIEPPTRAAPSHLARFARWGPDLPDAAPPAPRTGLALPTMPDRPESPV